jgi:transcriptional regulator with XRE-family HTH domain
MSEFAHWLKHQLEQRKISYRQFEADTNIPRSNLSRYLTKQRVPTVTSCNLIADYFARLDAKQEKLTNTQQHNRFTVYLLHINATIMIDTKGQ